MVYLPPLRSPPIGTARFNPHHDKGGKFAPGGGGGWKHQSAADIEQENVAFWETQVGRKLTDTEMSDLKVGGYLSAGDVRQRLTKGKMTIDVRTDGVSRERLDQMTAHIDRLHATYPVKADGGRLLQVNVRNPKDMPNNVAAETVHGRGFINISSDAVNNAPGWDTSHLMPAAKGVDRQTYVLTHEWGHAIDDDSKQLLWAKHFTELSAYGGESPREAKAEAFAEWSLSSGKTNNPAAIDYAKELGWGVMP